MIRRYTPSVEANGFLRAPVDGTAAFDPVEAVEHQFMGLDFLDGFPPTSRKDWRSCGPAVLGELAAPCENTRPLLRLLIDAHVADRAPIRVEGICLIPGVEVGEASPARQRHPECAVLVFK